VAFDVGDLAASRRFYSVALGPWGAREVSSDGAFGYGPRGSEDLWIAAGQPGAPLHIALHAPSRAVVDAFYDAGLGAGGRDNGAPGLRSQYHAEYYAAYLLDPDGNNVEAVHHGGRAQGF
jgi:catechol 2,3-dioxygenase-like lactoylglutathione lyase family enzyme